MIPMHSRQEYEDAKSHDLLALQCENCECSFTLEKRFIKKYLEKDLNQGRFCGRNCFNQHQRKDKVTLICDQCGCNFKREKRFVISDRHSFCSRSCRATYSNLHKKNGIRRSKLEIWLEDKLSEIYPDLEIIYNDKRAINAELDIYVPSLGLAVEINGIFHYEPIFGEEKLEQIQNNDQRKHQACYEAGIEILWIDTSGMKYFKEGRAQKFLDKVCEIINLKSSTSQSESSGRRVEAG